MSDSVDDCSRPCACTRRPTERSAPASRTIATIGKWPLQVRSVSDTVSRRTSSRRTDDVLPKRLKCRGSAATTASMLTVVRRSARSRAGEVSSIASRQAHEPAIAPTQTTTTATGRHRPPHTAATSTHAAATPTASDDVAPSSAAATAHATHAGSSGAARLRARPGRAGRPTSSRRCPARRAGPRHAGTRRWSSGRR